MFDFIPSHRQIGIRQRSLRRHCRLGRATELVFVLATGATLVIGGQAQAQQTLTAGYAFGWDPGDTGSLPGSGTVGTDIWYDDEDGGVGGAGNDTSDWIAVFGNTGWIDEGEDLFGGGSNFASVAIFAGTGQEINIGDTGIQADSVLFQGSGYSLGDSTNVGGGIALNVNDAIAVSTGNTATINAQIVEYSGVADDVVAGSIYVGATSGTTSDPLTVGGTTSLANDGGGTLNLNGGVTGSLINGGPGTLNIGNGTDANIVTGDVTTAGGSTYLNAGTTVNGEIRANGGTTYYNGATVSSPNLRLNGGNAVIAADTSIGNLDYQSGSSQVTVEAGNTLTITNTPTVTVANGGVLSLVGSMTGADVTTSAGTILSVGDGPGTSVGTLTGTVTLNDNMTVSGDYNITGNLIQNAGTITATQPTGDVTLAVSGFGNLNGNIANTGTGTFYITTGGAAGGSPTTTSGTVVYGPSALPTITYVAAGNPNAVTGSVNYAGDIVVDSGAILNVANDYTVGAANSTSDITNRGTINIAASGALTAQTTDQSLENEAAGIINVGANADLVGQGTLLNNAGTINVSDGGDVTTNGAITNSGTLAYTGSGTLTADANNDGTNESITNSGTLNASGGAGSTVTVSTGGTGTFTSTGQINVTGGGTLDVSGVSAAGTDLTQNTGGALTVTGSTLTGNVTVQDGTASLSGATINGELVQNGGATTISDAANPGGSTVTNITGPGIASPTFAATIQGNSTIAVNAGQELQMNGGASEMMVQGTAQATVAGTVSASNLYVRSTFNSGGIGGMNLQDGAVINGNLGLQNGSNTYVNGDVTVNGGFNGIFSSGSTLTVGATGAADGTNTLTSTGTILVDQTSTLNNNGEIDANVLLRTNSTLNLAGDIIGGHSLELNDTGTANTLNVTADSEITGGILANLGTVTVNDGATLTSPTVSIGNGTAASFLNLAGSIVGDITINATSRMRITDALTSVTGDIVNNGDSVFFADSGGNKVLNVDGSFDAGSTGVNNSDGVVNDVVINVTNSTDATQAKFSSSGLLDPGSHVLTINAYEIELRGTDYLNPLSSGTVNLAATNLLDYGVTGRDLDINGTLSSDLEIQSGATAVVSGNSTVGANNGATDLIVRSGGTLTVNSQLTYGSLLNQGDLIANATIIGTGNTFTNAGNSTIADGVDIIDNGGFDNQSGANLTFAGTSNVQLDQDNAGGEGAVNAGNILLNGAGDTVTFTTGGAGGFSNTGSITTNGNTLNVADTGLANSGTGTITMTGGTIIGDITNTATVAQTIDGTVTGNYSNAGTGTVTLNGGSISGVYEQAAGGVLTDVTGAAAIGSGEIDDGALTVTTGLLTATGGLTVGDGVGAADSATATITTSVAGDITINSDGQVTANNGAAIGDTDTVTVNGGELVLGANETIGALAGASGDVTLGANTLTVAGTGVLAQTTFGGTIAGTGGLTIDTADASLLLNGTNTYTGDTTLTGGGLLEVAGGSAIADTGAVVLTAGGLTVTNAETIGSISGGGNLTLNDTLTVAGTGVAVQTTYSGAATGAGGLTINGATADLVLSGDNLFTGATSVQNGALTVTGSLDSTGNSVSGGTLTVNATADASVDLIDVTVSSGGALVVTDGDVGTVTNNGTTNGTPNVTLTGGTTASLIQTQGDTLLNGGTLTALNQTGGATVVDANSTITTISALSGGSLTVNAGDTLTATNDLDATGTASVVINGALIGDLSTAGAATFDVNGTTGVAPVEVIGTITQGSSGASFFAGDVSGLVTVNAGSMTVDGQSVLTSGFDVNGGTLVIAANTDASGATGTVDGTGAGEGALTVNTGAILTGNVNAGSANTAATPGSGTGGGLVTVNGSIAGNLDVSNDARFVINGPTGGATEVTGTVTYNAVGTGANASLLAGDIGSLNITNSGTVQTTGDVINNGLTFVDGGGTLDVQTGTYSALGGDVQVGFSNTGTTTDGTLSIASGAQVSGGVNIFNQGVITMTGAADGTDEITGNLTFAGTALTNPATGTSSISGDIGGNVTVQEGSTATVNTAAALIIGGNLDIDAGTVNLTDATTVNGAVTVDGAVPTSTLTVGNDVDLTVVADVTVGGATATATNAVLDVDGSILGGGILNTNGTVQIGDGAGANTVIGGNVTQNGGTLTMTAGNGASEVSITGTLDVNTGSGLVDVTAGTVTAGTVDLADDTTVSIGANATLQTTGGAAADMIILGDVTVGAGGSLIAADDLTIGTLDTANQGSVTFTNGGTISDEGTLVNRGVLNVQNGTVTTLNDSLLIGGSAGLVNITGGTFNLGTGTVQDENTGTFATNAILVTASNSAATLAAAAVTLDQGGDIVLTGTATGDASIDLGGTGTLTLSGGSDLTINSATNTGRVLGNVQIGAGSRFDINGTIGGTSEVTGNLVQGGTSALNQLAGEIGAFLQQTGAGTITVDGDSSVGNQIDLQAGTLTVNGGVTLNADTGGNTTDDILISGGLGTIFNNNGTTNGNVTNGGTFNNAGTQTGTVANTGTFNNTGSAGATTNNGATSIANLFAGSTVASFEQTNGGASLTADSGTGPTYGTATVTGLLNLDAGTVTIEDGMTLQGGTVDIEAPVTVTMQAAGAGRKTTLSSTGALDNAATFTVNTGGQITSVGALTNSGTLTFNADNVNQSELSSDTGTMTNLGEILVNSGTVNTDNTSIVLDATNGGTNGRVSVTGATLNMGTGAITTQNGSPAAVASVSIAAGGGNAALLQAQNVTLDNGAAIWIDGNASGNASLDLQGGAGTLTVNGVDNFYMSSLGGGVASVDGNVVQNSDTSSTALGGTTSQLDGTITGFLDINHGTVTVATTDNASTVGGAITVDASVVPTDTTELLIDDGVTLNATNGVTVGAATTTAANAILDVDGNLTRASGSVAIQNTNGTVQLGDASGTSTVTGQIVQTLGTTTVEGNTNVTDSVVINGGSLVVNAGVTNFTADTLATADPDITIAGGASFLNNGVTTGNVSNAGTGTNNLTLNGTVANSGTFQNAGTGTINGSVSNTNGFDNDGAITGNFANAGTLNHAGSIGGNLTQTAGTTIADGSATVGGLLDIDAGTLVVNAGQALRAGSADIEDVAGVTIGAGGTLETTTGAFNTADQVAIAAGGSLIAETTFTNEASGVLNFAGNGVLSGGDLGNGTVDNFGTINALNGGTVQDAGDDILNNTGTINLSAGSTLTFGVINNNGTVNMANNATVQGTTNTITNNGTININGSVGTLVDAGAIMNAGQIQMATGASQTLNIDPGTPDTFTNTGLINMADGETGDRVNIAGNAVLNGTIQMDVNVTGAPQGTSGVDSADLIAVTGTATGAPTLAFSTVGAGFAQLGTPIDVITAADTTGLNASSTGLPTSGALVYTLNNTGTAVQVQSSANLAIGGVAAGVAAAQSLISSVVNRPSSALVTPLVNPGDDPCAIGTWSRITGGRADAKLDTRGSLGTLTSDIDLRYRGIQAGFDKSCSGGFYNGWDLAYGAMLGTNGGDTFLPVDFAGTKTNVSTEFDQVFGGAYVSIAKGAWFGDLALRADRTTYSVQEDRTFAQGGLGVEAQDFDSNGRTVSGSLSYSHTLNQEKSIRFVPTVGFSFSQITTDKIVVEGNPGDPSDDATLEIKDINQRIGYVGATLARTQVAESGDAAATYFLTGTYFNDFGDDITSVFRTATGTEVLTSENLGGFGELSIGMNYTKLYDSGSALPARQLDASVRADTRFSESLDSWGLTAQVRLQF